MKKQILFICAFTCAMAVNAQTTTSQPIPVASGFNYDCIASADDDVPTGEGPLDGHGSQLVTYSVTGVSESDQVIPNTGILTTESNHTYRFGSFTGNNCLYLGITSKDSHELGTATTGTITFSSATQADKLGILMVGTNRDAKDLKFSLVVNYSDGTQSDAASYSVSDWGQNNLNDAVYTLSKRYRPDASSNPEGGTFYLSEIIATVDANKSIKSLDITTECEDDNWGYGSLAFFAFSAIKDSTTGISTVTTPAKIEAVYNVSGQRLSEPSKGLNVIKYTDGTVKTFIIK